MLFACRWLLPLTFISLVGSLAHSAPFECSNDPTELQKQVPSSKPKDGRYRLNQAEVTWEIAGEPVTVQWLSTPVGPVVSVVCPSDAKLAQLLPNIVIRTEALLNELEWVNGKPLLIDDSSLIEITTLFVDQEIHPQESRESRLSLRDEGLEANSLAGIDSLKVYPSYGGVWIEYLNVKALYQPWREIKLPSAESAIQP